MNKKISIILEKIAKYCLYALIFITPFFFLPFTANPIEMNKQAISLFLVFISFSCYLILCLKRKIFGYPKNIVFLSVLALLIVALASSIFSVSKTASILGDFSQSDTLASLFIYSTAFFLGAVLLKKEDFPKIGICFLVGVVFLNILGLLQIFGIFVFPWVFTMAVAFNPAGSVFNWGIFAALEFIVIVSVLINSKYSNLFKIVLSLAGILAAVSLFVINYQLIWMGLALAMALLVALRFSSKLDLTLPLIILVVSLFFSFSQSKIVYSLANIPAELRPSFSATLEINKNTMKGVNMILGSGPGTFGIDYARFRPIELNQTNFWQVRFNQGFSFLATVPSILGILGIASFLFLIAASLWKAVKSWRKNQSATVLVCVAFLIFNWLFYPAFFAQSLLIFTGLGILSADSVKEIDINHASPQKKKNLLGFSIFALTIALLISSLLFLYSASQKYMASFYYGLALNRETPEKTSEFLEKAVKLNPNSDLFLRELSQVRIAQASELIQSQIGNQDSQSAQTQFQNFVALAVNFAEKAIQISPMDPYNYANLGNIYERLIPINQADILAQENYRKALELDAKNPHYFVDVARIFVISADGEEQKLKENKSWLEKIEKAKEFLEKSIILKQDYGPAHFLMAQIYVREGNLDKAIEKVSQLVVVNPQDSDLAFQLGFLYYKNNQLDEAQREFARAASLNENYSNARYFLGLILDQKGDKTGAISQFENIEKLNSDNQEVKKILKNLRAGKSALDGIAPPAQLPTDRIEAPVLGE